MVRPSRPTAERPSPVASRRARRMAAVVLAALALGVATTGCAGRLGRNDYDPVPGEQSPARPNVPPDGPGR